MYYWIKHSSIYGFWLFEFYTVHLMIFSIYFVFKGPPGLTGLQGAPGSPGIKVSGTIQE